MRKPSKNDLPLMSPEDGIVLFHPHVPTNAKKYVCDTLSSRWIGQGPKVDQFEKLFKDSFALTGTPISTGSGTDALHLAYLLASIQAGDEVVVPVFTCTATNIPLLYIGAKIVFVDVDPKTLNICPSDLRAKVTERTKAIVIVHYGGLPCDMDEIRQIAIEFNIPIIDDSAHALGAKYSGDHLGNLSEFTMYSFQAIKHVTTGDGGMLLVGDPTLVPKAKRLRWFGINREDKQRGIWENDITEVGYKYQMTDIAAALGIAGLEEFPQTLQLRKRLYNCYLEELSGAEGVNVVHDDDPRKETAAWLFTIIVDRRAELQIKLRSHGIESGQTHYRNDRYSIFGDTGEYPQMDMIDEKYLILPLHTKMSEEDVHRVCNVIKTGW